MIAATILAQGDAASSGSGLGLDNLFLWTILVVIVASMLGAVIRRRQRDKCLKLLNDHHVTLLTTGGQVLWGDLIVYSQGLEVRFDAPYQTRRGLTKTSAMLFDDELGQCLALCRIEEALTPNERRVRERQIRRSFNPGPWRRSWRWVRNVVNTLRDALTQVMGMFAGKVGKGGMVGGVVKTQRTKIDELSKTLVGAAGNAYEPMLERHIGRPVILELVGLGSEAGAVCEIPGFLVDYSDRFVAVFNVGHEPLEEFQLQLTQSVQREGVKLDVLDDKIVVTATGEDTIVVRSMKDSSGTTDLGIVLVGGSSVRLTRPRGEPVTLHLQRTRHIDIVCPRSIARVRYAGDSATKARRDWTGAAPQEDDPAETAQPPQ